MKKKLLTSVLCVGLAMSMFTGCGNKKEEKTEAKMGTLAEYKGLEVTKSVSTVKDSDVETQLKSYATAHNQTSKKEKGKVADGDNVNIDYTGKIDGQEFDGGSADEQDLTIGSGTFIDGFEDGLIGKTIGDTVTLNLTFPDDYTDSKGNASQYAGKDVVFEVKINYVTITTTPKVTDAFVKKYYSYAGSTVKEFKEYIKKDIRKNQILNDVWADYVDSCKVDSYDSDALADMKKQYEDYYEYMYYTQYGADLDTYLEALGQSKSDWKKQITKEAKAALKQQMIIEEIADKENVNLDKIYSEEAKSLAEQNTYQDVSAMESAQGKENVESTVLRNKVYEIIVDNVKVVKDEKTTAKETTAAQETTKAE